MSLENKTEKWFSLIEGKSVAVVGGDDDIDWSRVNECEVVVRVNNHWWRQRGRCDVIYYSCADDVAVEGTMMFQDERFMSNLRWAWLNITHQLFGAHCGQFPLIRALCTIKKVDACAYYHAPAMAWQTFGALRNCPPEVLWSRKLVEDFDFYPLTGILAIHHLLISGVRSVYVDGMSFYQRPDGILPVKVGRHHMKRQVDYLRLMSAVYFKDKLVLSTKLQNILADLQFCSQ